MTVYISIFFDISFSYNHRNGRLSQDSNPVLEEALGKSNKIRTENTIGKLLNLVEHIQWYKLNTVYIYNGILLLTSSLYCKPMLSNPM